MSQYTAAVVQVLLLLSLQNVSGLDPIVETDVGLIKGLKATDGDYAMFLGIPYGEVNLVNPFGPATPYPIFNETFEAFDDSVTCFQLRRSTSDTAGTSSLQCLNLNIHVPDSADSNNLLPVMVFIHGGSFATGHGGRDVYGPKFLVKHDVILVTLNYRVGVYGFMCLGTPEVPGNQGLKDQLMALKWVNANIRYFGGDPDKVTLFGHSAGGRAVDFHLMANNENLFSKAILQSGNSVSAPSITTVNTELPIDLAKELGFDTDDFRVAVSFLTTVDPQLLVNTAFIVVGSMFQACVENEIDGQEGYVPDFTINRKVPTVNNMPVLTGFTTNERYFYHVSKEDSYYEGLDIFGNFLKIYFTLDDDELANVEKLVRTFYIGDEEISADVKHELVEFDSDFTYIHPLHRGIAQYISNNASNVYCYMFSYAGERDSFNDLNIDVKPNIHGGEIAYLFDVQRYNETPNAQDQLMIDRMTTMWTNFAKYGDPTPETTDLLPEKWQPISESSFYYYNINAEPSLSRRPLNPRMTYLDLLFKMYETYQKGFKPTD